MSITWTRRGVLLSVMSSLKVLVSKQDLRNCRGTGVKRSLVTAICQPINCLACLHTSQHLDNPLQHGISRKGQECACLAQLSTLVLVLRASGHPTQFLCEPYRSPPTNRHPNFACPRTTIADATRDQRLRAQTAVVLCTFGCNLRQMFHKMH